MALLPSEVSLRITFNDECEDINECALGISSCPISQRCDNSIGSYICTREVNCGTGYTYNSDNQQCTDDNECELGTHNCGPAYDCHNLQGSFRCTIKTCPPGETINLQTGVCREVQCARGFRADIQGNCVDVNECETRPDTCRRNQRCHNTIGSYECKNLLNCGTGYELSEDGTQCMDLDECTTGTHECRGGQICRNRPGGYTCQCETGYIYNGIIKICEDINECERYGSYICSRTADCINTPGSYTCECHDGFRADETGKICRDINECEESTTICHQQCLNTWGSYQCHCDSGYQLAEDKRTCRDIDECSLWSGRGSLCIGYCENTPGSYACTCPQGYTLSTDGRTCQDNDECETNPCQLDELCLNTRGDKKCITITCPQNYVKDPDQNNRCTRESVVCQQGDQACINRPLAVSYNHLAFQSNMHIRPGGLDFFTMRGALWSTTTLRFEMEMVNARVPQSIVAATQESFRLKRVGANQAIIALMEPLKGPQEVELSLKMKIFSNGQYAGVAVAKIYIYVSPHDF
ncbi:PREDICTED: fibulin-1-like [Priapulus caudatus]|uniref:Fibulin-1-like n=1 Tax=Priapulus caudatus TaxID=37621 RepID=A0ABM1EHT5_PRICU|nr:PREDICTED: fibulin-1-like [Priapulus caudatus]